MQIFRKLVNFQKITKNRNLIGFIRAATHSKAGNLMKIVQKNHQKILHPHRDILFRSYGLFIQNYNMFAFIVCVE